MALMVWAISSPENSSPPFLYRYAQFKGYDTTQGGMAVREFSDYENISDYARPAMAWAVNAGIMGGMDDGTLMPQGKATRAEAATMLMNFCENMVEKKNSFQKYFRQ